MLAVVRELISDMKEMGDAADSAFLKLRAVLTLAYQRWCSKIGVDSVHCGAG